MNAIDLTLATHLLEQYGLATDDDAIDADTLSEDWPCCCGSWSQIGRCGHPLPVRMRRMLTALSARQRLFFMVNEDAGIGKKLRRDVVRRAVARFVGKPLVEFCEMIKDARVSAIQRWYDAVREDNPERTREMVVFFGLMDLPDADLDAVAWQLRAATINWFAGLFPAPPPALARRTKEYWTDLHAMGETLALLEPSRYAEPEPCETVSLAMETEAQAAVMSKRRGEGDGYDSDTAANPLIGYSPWHPGDAIRLTPEQSGLAREVHNGANGTAIAGRVVVEQRRAAA